MHQGVRQHDTPPPLFSNLPEAPPKFIDVITPSRTIKTEALGDELSSSAIFNHND